MLGCIKRSINTERKSGSWNQLIKLESRWLLPFPLYYYHYPIKTTIFSNCAELLCSHFYRPSRNFVFHTLDRETLSVWTSVWRIKRSRMPLTGDKSIPRLASRFQSRLGLDVGSPIKRK